MGINPPRDQPSIEKPRWCGLFFLGSLPSLKLTAKAPGNRPSQMKVVFHHPFLGAMLVSGRVNFQYLVSNWNILKIHEIQWNPVALFFISNPTRNSAGVVLNWDALTKGSPRSSSLCLKDLCCLTRSRSSRSEHVGAFVGRQSNHPRD